MIRHLPCLLDMNSLSRNSTSSYFLVKVNSTCTAVNPVSTIGPTRLLIKPHSQEKFC